MENYEYNNLIINNELDKLANINNQNHLVEYKYLKLYLIEYLLMNNIHTKIMDSRVQHTSKWIKFYLKYNVLKPLLKCYLKPLMEIVDGKLILDELLEKLTNDERMELLNNLKNNSYWELHDHEKEIIELYQKYGIKLDQTFINTPTILDSKVGKRKKDEELINEFCEVYKNTYPYILKIYLQELRRRLSVDNKRAREDIKKLIEHKKHNKDFTLQISNDTEGEYNSALNTITISPKRQGVLTHEMSHLMYQEFDTDYDIVLKEYESIRKKVTKKETIKKIVAYLKVFHEQFKNMENYFECLYYHQIKRQYGSYNEYIKKVCNDIYSNNPDIISVDDNLYFYLDDDNITDVATELLLIEKNEYKRSCTRNYYNEELMLENLLDALLKGAICDGKLDIDSFSGHLGRDFEECDNLSFDECLADYDTIKNSKKSEKLIQILKNIVGEDLIFLLDDYLEKNRGMKHGI